MTSFLPTLPSIFFSLSFPLSPVADPDLRYGCGGGGHPHPETRGAPGLKKIFFRPFGPQFGLKLRGEARASLAPPLDPPLLLVPPAISSFQSSSLPPSFLFPPCLPSVVPPFFPDPSTLRILLSLLPPAISVFTPPFLAIPPPPPFLSLLFFLSFLYFHSIFLSPFISPSQPCLRPFLLIISLFIRRIVFVFYRWQKWTRICRSVILFSWGINPKFFKSAYHSHISYKHWWVILLNLPLLLSSGRQIQWTQYYYLMLITTI